jgi:hypothetical protein
VQLRLDYLLSALRDRTAAILEAIDRDDLLVKRTSGDLVLANASQALYTPQEEHQLYAKGIVYRRDPYRLVSLPLIKIYNLGERNVTVAALADLQTGPQVRTRFLRKLDGSLVQVFRADGRTWLTTRGMIEGGRGGGADDEAREQKANFDYLGTARAMARAKYPRLLDDPAVLHERTLVFEFLHPAARVVTDYGDREDLVLLAAFDHRRFGYVAHDELAELGKEFGLAVVDALTPAGQTLGEQIEQLLASLAGTDQEGSVLTIERGSEVVYRAKVKSPDYLHLMRLMSQCSYGRTVDFLDANPQLRSWADLEAFLKEQGRDHVPEEVLKYYRDYYEQFVAYLGECERVRRWAEQKAADLEATLGGRAEQDRHDYRKRFAAVAKELPYSALLFAVLDGRLDVARIRKVLPTPEAVREAIQEWAI